MKHETLVHLMESAIFAAFLCICSPVTVPVGPIPFSMSVFAVMLCGVVLDWKSALLAVLVYLLLGLFLPIFSGGNNGLAALPGPTGGYIWSFLLMIPVIRLFRRIPARWEALRMGLAFLGCTAAVGLCYVCGTLQFAALAGRTFAESLELCVIPFIVPDLLKALAASVLGVLITSVLFGDPGGITTE